MRIPFAKPFFAEEEALRVADIVRSGWVSQGPQVAEFERLMADFCGAKEAVATSSCTSAMWLALLMAGVGHNDEVICPSFTCMATANALVQAGAIPVFADIDPRTFNLDPASVAAAITPRTRAIMGVDQIGLPAEWDALFELAAEYNLALVEDVACALGGEYKGKRTGQLGCPATFSFHPRKIIATGEGGMILLNDTAIADRARRFRSHGASVSDLVRHKAGGAIIAGYPEPGFNVRMTDMQGALGVMQMARLPWLLQERRRLARRYDLALSQLDDIQIPWAPPHALHAYQSYLIRIRRGCRVSRDDLMATLIANGVSCRHGIAPLHHEPAFRDKNLDLTLPVTEDAAQTTIFLPIFPGLSDREQDYVIDVIRSSLRNGGTERVSA
jgi:dTDP-4-amino-4,6-dideoxygalactose transaminase